MSELHRKLGKLLQLERQRQNIELKDLATELKTTESCLEYIEAGDVASLPSELYFNLFAKSYAEAMGIDYAATIEAISEDIETPEEPTESDRRDAGKATTTTPTTIGNKPSERTTRPGSVGQLNKLAYLLGGVVVIFAGFLIINELFLDSAGKTGSEAETVDTTKTTASVPAATIDADTGLTGYNWDVPDYDEPSEITLQLRATSESWASVLADGDTVIFRTLVPYKLYEVTAKYRILVSVGLPSIVDIKLNGQPVNLPISENGRISRVKINQLNLKDILSRALSTAEDMKPYIRPETSRQTTETPTESYENTTQLPATDTIQSPLNPNDTNKSPEFEMEELADSTVIPEGQR